MTRSASRRTLTVALVLWVLAAGCGAGAHGEGSSRQPGDCLGSADDTGGDAPVIGLLTGITEADVGPQAAKERTDAFSKVVDYGFRTKARLVGDVVGQGVGDARLALNARLVAEGPNPLFKRRDESCKRSELTRRFTGLFDRKGAGSPDVIQALEVMTHHLHGLVGSGGADVIILSSMVNGAEPLRLDEPAVLARPTDELLADAGRRQLIPDCRGWRIYVVGAGRTAAGGMDTTSESNLREFWTGFFARCGGHLLVYETQLTQFPVPDVPLIPVLRRGADMVATVADGVLFDTGRADLRRDADAVLDQLLAVVGRLPGAIHVDGFTDSEGPPDVNRLLSEQRAATVARWLVAHDVAAARITTRGHGADDPLADNTTPEGRQQNRRVEVSVGTDAGS